MMTALLLYAYTQGVFSSRRIARACEERVDFMAVTALLKPDFRTVNDFRRRHLKALGELFVQVLKLCRRAGLAKLGHVALDGTKIKANASKHKAMSYARMQSAEKELADTVAGWLKRAEAEDEAEDRDRGEHRRAGRRSLRGQRLLLRGQPEELESAQSPRLHRDGSTASRRQQRDRQGREEAGAASGTDERSTATRGMAESLPLQKTDRRAGVWADQGSDGLPTLPLARLREGERGVADGLRRFRPEEAREGDGVRPGGLAVDLIGGGRGGNMGGVIEPKTADFAASIARHRLPGDRANSRTGS